MKEVNIQPKQQLGKGAYHTVFPYHKFQDKIIKTRMGDLQFIKDNPQLINKNSLNLKTMQLFQDNPEYFAKVYKLRPNYAVIEKLNTDCYKNNALKLMQGIFRFILTDPRLAKKLLPYTINPDISEPEDIDTAQFFHFLTFSPNRQLRKELIKYCNPELFNKFYNFFVGLEKLELPLKRLDMHDGNIGCDKEGNLKLLDV